MTPQPKTTSDPKNLIQVRSDESELQETKGKIEKREGLDEMKKVYLNYLNPSCIPN